MKRSTILEIIIFLYAILFIYTGISKLMDYSVFKEQLSESPILSPVAPLVAATLPWIEFLIVLMLVMPRWRLKGLYAAFTTMAAFTIYVIVLVSISSKLPCSCGGIMAQLSWPQHIIFNIAFTAIAIAGIILQKRQKKDNQIAWGPIVKNKQTIMNKWES
jgi:uncharacterized membrane protein YphA (DoxX/SURF4 family)